MSRISLQASRQGSAMAHRPDQRDKHVMVSLHINMLVERILWFEGVKIELWEILSKQFRCCQTGD